MDLKLNDKQVWTALQDASLAALHLFDTKQVSQLEWASSQLKPKQTLARFNTLLMQHVQQKLPTASLNEMIFIIQGFRNRQNKDLYQKVRQTIVDRKKHLFTVAETRHEDLINLFYTFASNRPKHFGQMKLYAEDDRDELIAHYEHELCEAAEATDAEHLTRLA